MFNEIVKELSESYNIKRDIISDCLKESIEEVLSQDLGYNKVNAVIKDNNVNLIAEINQHGTISYQELALHHIKNYHISEITRLLRIKLIENESKELYKNYYKLYKKLVRGKIIKKFHDDYLVEIENIETSNKIIAVCLKNSILEKDKISKDFLYFYVTAVRISAEENIYRVIITLSRINKALPVRILEELDKSNRLKNIRCVLREAGRSSILLSEGKISKDNLARLQSEFYGEYFKVDVRKREVVVNE